MNWLATFEWGVGLGEPVNTLLIEPEITALGWDWTNDWLPYVYGGYVWKGGNATEISYVFGYERECGLIPLTPQGLLIPTPTPTHYIREENIPAARGGARRRQQRKFADPPPNCVFKKLI